MALTMKNPSVFVFLLALLSPLILSGASFESTSKYLDRDGSLLAYIDFEGDGKEIATDLDAIYKALQKVAPGKAILPIDYDLLFKNLGFATVESWGLSSKELRPGLLRNRAALMMNGAPEGLLKFYFLAEAQPMPFKAAEMAPADANGAFSGTLNWLALSETVESLFVQALGPVGQMLVQSQLQKPVLGETMTLQKLLATLSTRWDGFYRFSLADPNTPKVDFYLQVSEAGFLVKELKALDLPVTFSEEGQQIVADFSPLLKASNFSLFAKSTESGDLVLYTDPTWIAGEGQPSLADTKNFKEFSAQLPPKALLYEYSNGFDIMSLIGPALEQDLEAAPFIPVIEVAIERLVGDFYKPYASACTIADGNILFEQYGSFSPKQLLGLVPLGFGAAIAIPAIEKANEIQTDINIDISK